MAVQKSILARTFTSKDGDYTITGATGALALGVPGNLYDASPYRAHTAVYPGAADGETQLQFGEFLAGEGIAINPREHANFGVFSDDAAEYGPLAASLYVRPGEVCTFVTFGHVVVLRRSVAALKDKMNARVFVDAGSKVAVALSTTKDDVAIMPDKIADWTVSTDYAKGAFVANGGKVYCAKADVAGADAFAADSWYEVSADTTTVYDDATAYTAGTSYLYYGPKAVCVVEVDGLK